MLVAQLEGTKDAASVAPSDAASVAPSDAGPRHPAQGPAGTRKASTVPTTVSEAEAGPSTALRPRNEREQTPNEASGTGMRG